MKKMKEYLAEVLADGVLRQTFTGNFMECAAAADDFVRTHDGCNEIRLKEIGNGEDD